MPYLDNGVVHDPADDARLMRQLVNVFRIVRDGRWRTLQEIADATGAPHASVSAQLRNLRKARFGGYTVNKRYKGRGLWTYQVEA